MAWLNASTVCSHSRLPLDSSSTSRAFSSASPACASTARVNISAPSSKASLRSPSSATAPMVRVTATSGARGDVIPKDQGSAPERELQERLVGTRGTRSVVVGDGELVGIEIEQHHGETTGRQLFRQDPRDDLDNRGRTKGAASSWESAVSRVSTSVTERLTCLHPGTASALASRRPPAPRL